MPVYSYECQKCLNAFDVMDSRQTLDHPDYKALCPKCNSRDTKKVIAPANFQLKGNNWASDSYGLKKGKQL